MSDPTDLRASSRGWLFVCLMAGFAAGYLLAGYIVREEMNDMMLDSPASKAPRICDFNLVPRDYEDRRIERPSVALARDGSGVHVVAMMVDKDTFEPYHFQAVDEDTRLYELDVEFSADRRIFEFEDTDRVVEVFAEIERQGKEARDAR